VRSQISVVHAAATLLATAMTIKKFKFLFLTALVGTLSCGPDYGMQYEVVEEIQPTEVVIDSFVQPKPPEKLDVLIVLDTSCSMSDNFQQVSTGVELLRGDIEMLTLDYKIGFINSGMKNPYFVGPYDYTSNSIDFLLAPYALGADWYERGFQSMYEFVTNTTEGAGFFRTDTDKLIIFVSDENEQGTIPTNTFHDWLVGKFEGVQHDVVSIVQVENGECAMTYELDIGQKYIDLAAYYGKTGIDICSDWEAWLGDSTFLVGEINYINLSQTPLEDSIVVYRNGIETELWYYLPETNTVYLDFVPDPGELIEVGYVIL
jgi:hypothetical protein